MKRKGCLSLFLKVFGGLLLLVALLLGGIAVYNMTLPERSPVLTKLSQEELARVAEITHLRQTLGDEVWPGWASMDIPILLYNEQYAFLSGMEQPDTGWVSVPYGAAEGGVWERVPQEDYYRQLLPEDGATPQAFIVRIGDTFAASMTTKEWTSIHMVDLIQGELPGLFKPVFPYFLFTNRFNSDWFISAVLHESFHVLQARRAYERLEESEQATALESEYPWGDDRFRELWVKERQKLAEALEAQDSSDLKSATIEWVALRDKRREQLPENLIHYEQRREWLEGLAKYAELAVWSLAYHSQEYDPVPEMNEVADFDGYQGAPSHRREEISQLQRDLQFGESMFYYTGWAQAELLDRLRPGWKKNIMESGAYLDDLLQSGL